LGLAVIFFSLIQGVAGTLKLFVLVKNNQVRVLRAFVVSWARSDSSRPRRAPHETITVESSVSCGGMAGWAPSSTRAPSPLSSPA
jgi:hypothetical protein